MTLTSTPACRVARLRADWLSSSLKTSALVLVLPLKVCLERVGDISRVIAPDAHHRREQAEGARGPHLEFVVGARRLTLLGENEAVAAFECLDAGNDADTPGGENSCNSWLTLPNPRRSYSKRCPVSDLAGIEPPGRADGGIPGRGVAAVGNGIDDFFDGGLDDLGPGDD